MGMVNMRMLMSIWISCLVSVTTLGQEWSFDQIQKLPSTVNSEGEEGMSVLSPDGKTLYFIRSMYAGNMGGEYGGPDIWVSTHDGARWSEADNQHHPFKNHKNTNAVVGVSADGKTVYLVDAAPNRKIKGIYFSRNVGGSWTDPELIPIDGIDSNGFVGFYVSPDFDVILVSMKGSDSRGQEDLYVSLKTASGSWSRPKNLGPSINTAGFEISPFLSADKKRLFFSSNGHQGFGDGDIFYAERLYASWETWSSPRNLGKDINTSFFDAGFSLYGDSVAFFVSNRNSEFSELYSTKVISTGGLTKARKVVLARSEIQQVFGRNAKTSFEFEKEEILLSLPQQEMLYYLARRAETIADLKIEVMIREENKPALTAIRLQAILAHLKHADLENDRIGIAESPGPMKTGPKAIVEIVFYREVTK